MKKLNLSGGWPEAKEKIKEADPRITDEMLEYGPDNVVELVKQLRPLFASKDDQFIKDWIEAVSDNTAKSG